MIQTTTYVYESRRWVPCRTPQPLLTHYRAINFPMQAVWSGDHRAAPLRREFASWSLAA